jgi:dephospho-CoA kinase
MRVIGILGGVASGKSEIARLLAERGCVILDADRAGHEVLEQPEVKHILTARWTNAILAPDGRIDRAAIARIVFPAPTASVSYVARADAERRFLEQLTHPRIGAMLQQQIAKCETGAQVPAVVLDAPLLLEAGWNEFCTTIVFVDAPREVRLARAAARGWSAAQFAAREAAQYSLDSKRRHAGYVIQNGDSLAAVAAEVDRFWQSFTNPKSADPRPVAPASLSIPASQ